jgi:hypothetical protein
VLLLALPLAACRAPRQPTVETPLPTSVEALAAAIAEDAKRTDSTSDSKIRDELAAEASRDAEACLVREPQTAACLYGHAIALGLEARAHPTHAAEFLKGMLESLTSAEAADATYDEAGPARVRALVLTRAPGWPLGPGDAEAGLAAARRAVTLKPLYPPNQLALAEAQAKTGDASAARQAYEHARDLAQALPPSADRAEWLREAEQALQRQ